MTFLYKNNATSRLKANVLSTDTTIVVLAGEGAKFPQPTGGDFFIVTLDDRRSGQIEIMRCTARTGDTLTVTRAQEDTVAQDFYKDATVSNRFTAGTIDEILSSVGYTMPEADAKFVDVAGDTMTGPLVLSGPPAVTNGAATKGYVDTQVATKLSDAPSDGNAYGRKNGAWAAVVDALTYTAADVLAKIKTVDGAGSGLDADLLDGQSGAYYLDRANHTGTQAISTVTGLQAALDGKAALSHTHTASQITDFAEAVDDRAAALITAGANITVTYNDTAGTLTIAGTGADAGTTISDTPPGSPVQGQTWWESDTGNFYVWYDDGNTSQWVEVVAGSGGDAGTLDGEEGSYYLDLSQHTGTISDTQHGNRAGGTLHAFATASVPGFFIDAPLDGLSYVRKDAGWVVSTTTGTAEYTYKNTALPPAVGEVRFDNATLSAATLMGFSYTTARGTDLKTYLLAHLVPYAIVYVQDKDDSAKWAEFEIVSNGTDQTTWAQAAVTYVNGGGVIANNALVMVRIESPSKIGNDAPADGKLYGRLNGTWSEGLKITGGTLTGALVLPAATTGTAGLKVPHGAAPTSPANGDVWSTTSGWFVRTNGVTQQLSVVGHTHAQSDITNLTSDLALKAPLASPALTGNPTAPTPTAGDNDTSIATTAFVTTAAAAKEPTIAAGTTAQYWRGDKTWQTLDKAAVGLANVDNTSDANKPVSTAQAAADALKVAKTGDTMTGTLVVGNNGLIDINKTASGQQSVIRGRMNGLSRWNLTLGSVGAESGGNAGSDLTITRYDDAGAVIDNPFSMVRSSGVATFGKTPVLPAAAPTAGAEAANKTYVDSKVAKTGDTMTGQLAVTQSSATAGIAITGSGANNAEFALRKGTGAAYSLIRGLSSSGLSRWNIALGNGDAESSGNAGSNFELRRYDDFGNSLTNALSINRATGLATLAGDPTAALGVATKQYVDAADATKIGDAPNDGQQYARKNLAWAVVAGGAGAAAPAPYYGEWTFSTTTTSPPAAGEIRFNASAATPESVTTVWISDTDAGGGNRSFELQQLINTGAKLVIRSKADPTKYFIFQANSFSFPSGYREISGEWWDYGADLTAETVLLSVEPKQAAVGTRDSPPDSPVDGDLWWESDTGNLYVYYDDGSTQQWVQVNAPTASEGAYPPGTVRFVELSSSGNYAKPAGLRSLEVWVVGGGGGGPACSTTTSGQSSASGGGGAGAVAYKCYQAADLAASEAYTIGAGSTAAGGTSTWKGITCTGGGAGTNTGAGTTIAPSGRGSGGLASGGDINIAGGFGGQGIRAAHGTATLALSGSPGINYFTPVGCNYGPYTSAQVNGTAGAVPGGGASGPANGQSQAVGASASGGDGRIYLTEHY